VAVDRPHVGYPSARCDNPEPVATKRRVSGASAACCRAAVGARRTFDRARLSAAHRAKRKRWRLLGRLEEAARSRCAAPSGQRESSERHRAEYYLCASATRIGVLAASLVNVAASCDLERCSDSVPRCGSSGNDRCWATGAFVRYRVSHIEPHADLLPQGVVRVHAKDRFVHIQGPETPAQKHANPAAGSSGGHWRAGDPQERCASTIYHGYRLGIGHAGDSFQKREVSEQSRVPRALSCGAAIQREP